MNRHLNVWASTDSHLVYFEDDEVMQTVHQDGKLKVYKNSCGKYNYVYRDICVTQREKVTGKHFKHFSESFTLMLKSAGESPDTEALSRKEVKNMGEYRIRRALLTYFRGDSLLRGLK